ncbi:hypothetical protein [Roseibium sp. M-1]
MTELTEESLGAHVIVGSHGGAPSGLRALKCGVASLICHDAGIGLDEAGVAALGVLEAHGIPTAAVGHDTARIGDPADMLVRGILSRVNAPAAEFGLCAGMPVRDAAVLLEAAVGAHAGEKAVLLDGEEFRRLNIEAEVDQGGAPALITIVDSASSVNAEDDGAIVVTGSHGGLPGNLSEKALKARPLLVAFNDAGIGIEEAGVRRLPVLAEAGVAAICVDAGSARIGDGLSTYQTGILSAVNAPAEGLGAHAGMPLREFISHVIAEARRTARLGAPETISKGNV